MKRLPTQAVLHEWFRYDHETGTFFWRREPRTIGHCLGRIAGTRRNGYIFIGVPGFGQIGAHRLAWIYVHGLTIGDDLIFLGYFNTPEEAHAAYSDAAHAYFGEFARTA